MPVVVFYLAESINIQIFDKSVKGGYFWNLQRIALESINILISTVVFLQYY